MSTPPPRGVSGALEESEEVASVAVAALEVRALVGMPEVVAGADLAELLLAALRRSGWVLEPGDSLVVSSKVVSKARGLTWDGDGHGGGDGDGGRASAVAAHTVRVVAEREGAAGVTRVVESVAGPVMAAAGVDASNTGPAGAILLLPDDPDAEAGALRSALLDASGLASDIPLGIVLSDTAGRPWRAGQTDFALGSAGLTVLDDLRGGIDADGRPLVVTSRAVADEVAAAADLVKGKADGVPAALVRGLPLAWFSAGAEGSRSLVRTGAGDWFALGPVEALRSALGVAPGSSDSEEVGLRSVAGERMGVRVGRVVALALYDVPDGSADVALGDDGADVALAAPDPYDLGRLVVRAAVAAASEDLTTEVITRSDTSVTLHLTRTDLSTPRPPA